MILLIGAFWSVLIIPFNTAFLPLWSNEVSYNFIDAVLYIVYGFEVLLNFNITYLDNDGNLVQNRKKITSRYLKNGLFLDLLQVIPFTLLIDTNLPQNMFAFITIISRFSRLGSFMILINDLSIDADTRSLLSLLMKTFSFAVILHWFACLWFIIVMYDKMWVPPMDFFYAGRPEFYKYYYEDISSTWIHYGTSIYYAVASVGGNELGPRDET